MGFEILEAHGARIDLSRDYKKKALKFYYCLRHMEGYEHKLFDSVNKAVMHIYKQKEKLLAGKHYSWDMQGWSEQEDLPDIYFLNIIHETFDVTWDDRWGSYSGLLSSTSHDRLLQRAMLMCMHIVIYKFGITVFDAADDTGESISMEDWFYMERENINDEIKYYRHEQQDNWKEDIRDLEQKADEIEEEYRDYMSNGKKILRAILRHKPKKRVIRRYIKANTGSDAARWMEHILFMCEQHFDLRNHMTDIDREEENIHDGDTYSPWSAFGFMYCDSGHYHDYLSSNWEQIQNNYTINPVCNYTVISSRDGVVAVAPSYPLYNWIFKIFDLNLTTLTLTTQNLWI